MLKTHMSQLDQGISRDSRASDAPGSRRCGPLLSVMLALAVAIALPSAARAQAGSEYLFADGQPAYSTRAPVEYGYVEEANGHLHLEIPLGAPLPQRGNKKGTQFRLDYESNIWTPSCWGPGCVWSPTNVPVSAPGNCGANCFGAGWTLMPWAPAEVADSTDGQSTLFIDANGGAHYFPTQSGTAYAVDSSGLFLEGSVIIDPSQYPSDSGQVVYGPDGSVEGAGFLNSNAYLTPIDPNGNEPSTLCNGATEFCDTTGRVALSTTQGGMGTYSVPNAQGGTSTYTVSYITIQLKTNFQYPNISECSGQYCTATVIASITLPDNSTFSFKYDCDSTISGQSAACSSPTGQSAYYGELTQITTPQGGTISYEWQTFKNPYGVPDEWLASRTMDGGTWTYTPHVVTTCGTNQVNCEQSLAATDPNGTTTTTTFQLNDGAWPIETQVTSSGQALSTVYTTWDFSHSCVINGCLGADYIRKLSETVSIPGASGTITKKTAWSYDNYQDGLVTAIQQWGWYPGSNPSFPTTPDRATYYSWYSPTAAPVYALGGTNVHRPASVTSCNNGGSDSACPGGGTRVSQTVTTYDQNDPSSLSGIVNHDDNDYPGNLQVRGNPTEVQRWVSGSTYVTSYHSYDETGQTTQTIDGNGNTTNYSYADNYFDDTNGNGSAPASTSPPNGPTNAYLTQITYPSVGGQTLQETLGYYYGSGQMAESTDFNGQATYHHYIDPFYRPTATLGPKDSQGNYTDWGLTVYTSPTETDSYTAVADGSPSSSCTSCRHTEITYDGYGRETSKILANKPNCASEADTTYDSNGRVASVSHPYCQGGSAVYEAYSYDSLGRVTRDTHPDGEFVQTDYGSNALSSGGPPEQGTVTAYPTLALDEAGKKREVWTDGFGETVEADDQLTAPTTATGTFGVSMQHPPFYYYGTITLNVGSAAQVQVQYNSNQSASQVCSNAAAALAQSGVVTGSCSGTTVNVTADAQGTAGDYSLSASVTAYLQNGSPVNPPPLTVSHSGMSGGSNGTSVNAEYSYDAAGRLTQVTQGSQTRSYSYDGLGRLISSSIPEASCATTYTYDSDGNLLTKTAPAPNQTSCSNTVTTYYAYDALNRLVSTRYSDTSAMPNDCTDSQGNSAHVCEFYDQGGSGAYALGRLTSMQDATGSGAYAYDAAGRETSASKTIAGQTYTTNYTLETDGQPTAVVYPSGRTLTDSYDAVGELTGVSNGGTNYVSISAYDAAGNVTSETYGNGVSGTFGYSANREQLTSLAYALNGTNQFALNYFYQYNSSNCATGTTDDDGLIQCIQDTVQAGRSASHTYDEAGRLLTAKTTGSSAYPQWGLSWTYDSYGNRLSQGINAGCTGLSCPTNSVSVSASTNHITTSGYGYDAAGNMTNDGASTLTYDDESKLTAASGSYGAGSYQYDGAGMRVEKTVSGSTTVYVFAGSKVIAEYASGSSPSSPEKEYIYAGGNLPVAEIDSGSTVKYYEADTLSVRVVTDSSGNVLANQGQFPYGESWYQSSTQTELQFTNYLHDSESNNEYAYAREYLNRLARFSIIDPAGGSVGDPMSWDRYVYARDNPINGTDPDGRDTWLYLFGGVPLDFANDQAAGAALARAGGYLQGGFIYVDYGDGPVVVGTYEEGAGYYSEAGGMQSANGANFAVGAFYAGLADAVTNFADDLFGSAAATSTTEAVPGLATSSQVAEAGFQVPAAVGSASGATAGQVARAATEAVGNESITVADEQAAKQAADEFLGPGARPISGTRPWETGGEKGWISSDGQRIVRFSHEDPGGGGAHWNFVNKVTGGNLHVYTK